MCKYFISIEQKSSETQLVNCDGRYTHTLIGMRTTMPTFYTLLHFWKYSPISNEEEFVDQELNSTFYHHN
ncbi:unnamed protein product, partial [Vitis vinifera]|uniref:Uncharacterized protein n=1 Tax=Vitis vinifera TaxID=29760 RepID=D7SYD4_VITVI